ncbi:hypothetical protein [Streptomyces sp. YIM B13518]|uniref:hypothetical protein n=1 Tax=Streptomyces sp. YIM B13518 TaxID=3366316 RepID=UPI0036C51808
MTDHVARPDGPASSTRDSLTALHAQCRADYQQAAANRAANAGAARDQLALGRAHAAEVAGR